MKIPFLKKALFVFIAFTLLLPFLPGKQAAVSAADSSTIPDGVYPIVFRYVKDNEKSTSVANDFVVPNSGRLVVEGGQVTFEHEVTKVVDSVFSYLGIRQPDAPKATTVWDTAAGGYVASGSEGYTPRTVKEAANPNHTVYSLPLYEPWAKQHDLLLFINDTAGILGSAGYVNWYNVQLELDMGGLEFPEPSEGNNGDYDNLIVTEEMFEERLAEGYSLYTNAVEGWSDGMYPEGTRAQLHAGLTAAEQLVAHNSSNLKTAYILADTAIKSFGAQVVVVNRARLQAWLDEAVAWAADASDRGEAEVGAPSTTAVVTGGEYPAVSVSEPGEDGWSYTYSAGPARLIKGADILANGTRRNSETGNFEFRNNYEWHVTGAIEKAQQLLADPLATQLQINSLFFELDALFNFEDLKKEQYIRQPITLLLLDSFDEDAKESPYAGEIDASAYLIQQAEHPYYDGYLNITFLTDESLISIGSAAPAPANGSYAASFSNRTAKVTADPAATANTFQIPVRSSNKTYLQTDDTWHGHTVIRYPNDSSVPVEDRKVVYISLNAEQLNDLNQLITEAQDMVEEAADNADVYPAFAVAKLQQAISSAEVTGDKLAATRPQILSATRELQAALEEFEASQSRPVYFSAVHATNNAFSSMHSYFAQPAQVARTEDGAYEVTVTITDSATVPEFRVERQGELVDSTVVQEDEETNIRTVSFVVDDLSGLVDAEVRNVVPSQNYDRVHSIRLNFNNVNNSELAGLVLTASTLQRTAVAGSDPGQYPAEAKAVFQQAIDAANEAAADVTGAVDAAALYTQLQSALTVFRNSQIPTGTQPGGGGSGPNQPSHVYPEDGTYTMSFQILKDGTDSKSMAQDYVITNALVEVRGSNKTVKFVVKQSHEIKSITIGGQSENIVERNTSNNTRVTSFTLPSLTGKLNGTVFIEWYNVGNLGFDYVNTYNIHFLFNESSAQAVAGNAAVPGWGSPGNVPIPGDLIGSPGGTPQNGQENEEEEEAGEDDNGAEEPGASDAGGDDNAPSLVFRDTAAHWARSSIDKAVKLGIVNGYSDGSFRPDGTVTRGEFAVMISRALGLEGEGDGEALRDFASIPDWAQTHVARAVAAGIIGGFEDATFRAGGYLTRAQLAVIIARAAGLQLDADAAPAFADAADIPAWAQKEVAAAVQAGLIQGKDGNRFDPSATATRAEALTLIIRLLEAGDRA